MLEALIVIFGAIIAGGTIFGILSMIFAGPHTGPWVVMKGSKFLTIGIDESGWWDFTSTPEMATHFKNEDDAMKWATPIKGKAVEWREVGK